MGCTGRRMAAVLLMLAVAVSFCACGAQEPAVPLQTNRPQTLQPHKPAPTPKPPQQEEAKPEAAENVPERAGEESAPTADSGQQKRYRIVIDPGHQLRGDYETEPIGPGAEQQKARVSSGTRGSYTGYAEHALNLEVSLYLREELLSRGYEVFLTREEADVSISNGERAELANALGADAFVRIHANGSEDPDRHGAMTICMTPDNPYHPEVYAQSRALSDAVLDALCAATGAAKEYVWETDTMSGINYCEVPVTIVEMGYMTNQAEDERLADPAYQQLMARGIADGIDAFLGGGSEA